jgi:hypothetical protein
VWYSRRVTRDDAIAIVQARGQTQSRTGAPWGNCLEAAVATLIGIPLAEIPDIRSGAEKHGVYRDEDLRALFAVRLPALRRWLAERYGLLFATGDGERPPWVDAAGPDAPPLFWVASGRSQRGFLHAVVCADHELIWDPHPARTGIETVLRWGVIVPLGPPRICP